METKSVGNYGQTPVIQTDRADQAQNTAAVGTNPTEKKKSKGSAGADKDWSVSLSPQAKEKAEAHAKAMNIARSTPDVRANRVEELKAKIKSGEYKVDAGNIADGMLKEAIYDELAKNPDQVY